MKTDEFLAQTMRTLQSNPTAADLDQLVSAYAIIGNIAADAQHEAEVAEGQRKYAQAVAYGKAKKSGEKVTDAAANAQVTIDTAAEVEAEIDARVRAKKVAALLDAVREAINAIKFLGRYDSPGAPVRLPR